jgi:hypothetical protein
MPSEPQRGPGSGLSAEELEAELATDLPEREALSIVDPGVFSVVPMPIGRTPDGAGPATPPVLTDEPPAN